MWLVIGFAWHRLLTVYYVNLKVEFNPIVWLVSGIAQRLLL